MRITDGRIRIIKAAEPEKCRLNGFFCLWGYMKSNMANVLIFVHINDMFIKNEQQY